MEGGDSNPEQVQIPVVSSEGDATEAAVVEQEPVESPPATVPYPDKVPDSSAQQQAEKPIVDPAPVVSDPKESDVKIEEIPRPAPSMSRSTIPPTTVKPIKATEDEEDDEDFEDETLSERLWGLTEMFPQSIRTATGYTVSFSFSGLKKLFQFSKSALWIGSTSFMVLILPIVFESEMVHMEQAQIQRQKQILLGPNAATAGGMTGGLTPPLPGIAVAPPPQQSR